MTKIELSQETSHYLLNGKEILKKAKKDGKFYTDAKYVKIAGHTLYSAMLLALDDIMPSNKKGRNTEKEYRSFLAPINKKTLQHFNSAYDILHRFMGYDGTLKVSLIQGGIDDAKTVIDWVLKRKMQN
ncbi:MAG: hypothetical protein DRJ10_18015 [Bacteroidetes bacterium]|nr:MAG: hypothetical protein DRJ10_18015 [Bacteroidota bacterium]